MKTIVKVGLNYLSILYLISVLYYLYVLCKQCQFKRRISLIQILYLNLSVMKIRYKPINCNYLLDTFMCNTIYDRIQYYKQMNMTKAVESSETI